MVVPWVTSVRAGSMVLGVAALLAGASAWVRVERVHATHAWIGERAQLAPGVRGRDRYVGSSACKGCHPDAWQSWHDSWHRTMTQLADKDTIAAQWEGTTLPDGTTLAFDGARPIALRGAQRDPIVLTTGAHHLQIFWTPSRSGDTLHALPWAWLVDEQRFVPNDATLLRPAGEPASYTWNRVCIRCHAVAGSPGWHAGTGAIDTRVVELGIACESCHGPGRAHALAHREPWARGESDRADPTIVNPARLDASASAEICAQCHAFTLAHDEDRWLAHGPDHAPPDPLATWATLVRHPARADLAELDAVLEQDADYLVDRFWPDGMVRVTGREHGAMIESACAKSGELSCLSCHSMHASAPDDQLREDARGDGACTSCHEDAAYAAVAHHHHDVAGEGARCTGCHMPRTSWGLLGAIRSHQIDAPDPDVADDTGRPLACNLCHLDRSRDWSRSWWTHWWRDGDAPAAQGSSPPAALEWILAGDAGQRAIAAWHLGRAAIRDRAWVVDALLPTLDDPYPAVRLVGWRALALVLGDAMPRLDPGVLPEFADIERIRAASGEAPRIDRGVIESLRKARNQRRVALAE